MLADLEMLAEVCDIGSKVVVIGHINDVLLYRELMRRDISDYLVAPVDATQLGECIAAALKGEAAEALGRVIAFIGAKGGCGSSTVCHNTGWVFAELMRAETVIADFDLAFGTLGLDFNQDAGHGLCEALAASHRLDTAMITNLLSKCSDQLGLLTASYALDDRRRNSGRRRAAARRAAQPDGALRHARSAREWRDWTRALFEKADDIVITAEPDLANLRNAKNLIDTARAVRATGKPPILVLNKVGMPRRPEISQPAISPTPWIWSRAR